MRFPRSSGLLLHPTSLPGGHGVGDLGPSAYEFLEFLKSAGQSLWQVLPLGPTGYEDSPYQTFSASAGNPLLLSLDRLAEQGLLEPAAVKVLPRPPGDVNFEAVLARKTPLLRRAAQTFSAHATTQQKEDLSKFVEASRSWLDDFALFMTLKEIHGMSAWTEWPAALDLDGDG